MYTAAGRETECGEREQVIGTGEVLDGIEGEVDREAGKTVSLGP